MRNEGKTIRSARNTSESEEGLIDAIYDCERRGDREILMTVFSEADVEAGEIVSSEGRLRVLVNRAGRG